MGTWDQGSLGEMRTSSLLNMLQEKTAIPVVWLPLVGYEDGDPRAVEVIREQDLEMVYGMDWDEAVGEAFRECLQGIAVQMRRDNERVSSLVVDAPGEWGRPDEQGVIGPVRVGLIRDWMNFKVRVGIRVVGIPHMLPSATEVQVLTNISHISQGKDQYNEGDNHATVHPYLPSI